jgi:hypothetical protein
MSAVAPLNCLQIRKPQVEFIDQAGGLQGVTIALAPHTTLCRSVKFPVDLRGQFLQGVGVAQPPRPKQLRDLMFGALSH